MDHQYTEETPRPQIETFLSAMILVEMTDRRYCSSDLGYRSKPSPRNLSLPDPFPSALFANVLPKSRVASINKV